MRTRLPTILGLILVGIAVVVVQSSVREKPDASTGGTGSHGTTNPKRPAPDPATFKPGKLPRSSQRASFEELIRQAESLYAARKHDAALELAMLAVDRAPNGEAALPHQLRNFLRVLQGEPQYVGTILNVDHGSFGGIYMSTELTPAQKVITSRPTLADEAGPPPEVIFMPAPSPIVVRACSVKNMGDFRKGDVVKVWASCLMTSLPPQVDALRIQKVE